jgi:hypothetical protein
MQKLKIEGTVVKSWIAIAGCAALLLAACGSVPTESGFRDQMNQYYAGSINSVVDRFGPADLTEKKPNGNTLYTWTRVDSTGAWFYQSDDRKDVTFTKTRVYGNSVEVAKDAAGYPYRRERYQTSTITIFCVFIFEAGADQRVIGYEYWGNMCTLPAKK